MDVVKTPAIAPRAVSVSVVTLLTCFELCLL